MPLCIEPKAEPIPGYRLIEKLGTGGFGEVWRAEAPGGLLKAIKFVHGDTRLIDEDGSHRAEQELKAIQRVQGIRHPYLLSIERYDVVDGRLIIVTELADGNLFDRFDYYRNQGLPGIPRPELLRHMREAAEALDLLNEQYQLQHLDVKPQNIFLIHDHVKVADFGLVKNMEGSRTEMSGGVTPVYAAPETFEGTITPFCDQYSLAIVYQELLTGHRPFAGSSMQQLAMQHLKASPNLAPLPHADRPPVARALAKKPENRHDSCMALVDALAAAGVDEKAHRTAARVTDSDRYARQQLPNVAASIRRLEHRDAKPHRPETPPTMIRIRREDTATAVEESTPRRTAPPEFTGNGVLFPSLIIGLGRAGMLALRRIRHTLSERFGGMSAVPHLKLLLVDSDPETADEAMRGGPDMLEADEVFLMRLNRASHYLKPRRNGRSLIEGWFDSQWLYRIPRNPAVQGQRALGRLAFGDHYIAFADRVDELLEQITSADALLRGDRNTTLGVRTNRPSAYVISSLGGGTGSGMCIDIAYAVRHRLRQFGYEQPEVFGHLLLPEVERPPSLQSVATANTFAALTELVHFHHPESIYRCTFDDRDAPWSEDGPPFSRTCVIPWQRDARRGSNTDGPTQVAGCIANDLISPLGRTLGQLRDENLKSVRPSMEASAATFGMSVLAWPKRAVLRCGSRRLCCAVIQRWSSRANTAVHPAIEQWVQDQCQSLRLNAEELAKQLTQSIESVLGQPASQFLAELGEKMKPRGWFSGGFEVSDAHELLGQFDVYLGRPEGGNGAAPGGIIGDTLLSSADAILKEWGGQLAQMVVALIEQPEYRLAGAEHAVAVLRGRFEDTSTQFWQLGTGFGDKAVQASTRMDLILKDDLSRRTSSEFLELAKHYPMWRYHAMFHRQIGAVAQTLANDLMDQLGEIGFCRQRLEELLEAFARESESPPEFAHDLFPASSSSSAEAVQKLLAGVSEADYRDLDAKMQRMVQSQFKALVHVCLSTSNMMAGLEPAMLKLAQQFLSGRIGDAGAAELFLSRHADVDDARSGLRNAFDCAAPPLGDSIGVFAGEVCSLSVPSGTAGERIAELAGQAIDDASISSIVGPDEITFYRELPRVPLTRLPQFGPQAREAFQQTIQRDLGLPHTRTDIETWLGPIS